MMETILDHIIAVLLGATAYFIGIKLAGCIHFRIHFGQPPEARDETKGKDQ